MLNQRLDGLQLPANQPGSEAFKASGSTPLWEGSLWEAGERISWEGKALQCHGESGGSVTAGAASPPF